MKFFKIVITFLILLQTTTTLANENLDRNLKKAFKKFSQDINKVIKKSEKLKTPENKEAQIIDNAINELKIANDFIKETYLSGDFENTENTLDFITRSISDIQKLVPQEISSDMSKIDMKSVKPEDIAKIKKITNSMKKSKNEKLLEFVDQLESLSNTGLNVYSISYNLNNLGIDTINFTDILKATNSNPELSQKTLNSIEKNLEKAGVSSKNIEQIKDDIKKISLPKDGVSNPEDDPKVKELKNLIEKAKDDRENAEKAKEQRDAAVKAAEEAQEEAKKAQATANSIADQTSKAAKEAAEKAQEAAKEANKAAEEAQAANFKYKEMRSWLKSTRDAIKKIEGSIQGVNENYNSLETIYNNSVSAKNIKDISNNDFVSLEGLVARTSIENSFGIKATVTSPADQLFYNVVDTALEQGLSQDEAFLLASNAKTRFLDMKFVQQNAITRFKSQGMTNIQAEQKSFEILTDKYSDWMSNIGFGRVEDRKISHVDAWITSVAMAKKAATDFGTLDPNDEKELRSSAKATADKVLQEALNQGFSKDEAEQIANNTFDTMFSGLKFAYQTGEALLQKGLSEAEMDKVLSKMMKDRFGTVDADFFTPGNLGDIGDEKAVKFYVTGLGALKYAMENREKSINPDDVDEVETAISDTEKLVRERAAKLGITDQAKIDKFALDAKNSVIDLYHFGYAIEDYLGGPENKGPCDQNCIDENIDFILDKFYSKWGSRLFDVKGEELKLDTSKIDVYVTGLVITESSEAAKRAKENAEKAVKEAESTLNKAKELEQKAKDAQAKADQIKDKTSKEYKDAVARAESAQKAAKAARDLAEKAKNASDEARKAFERAEKELARLEQELKNLLGEIGGGDLGSGEKGAWDPRGTIAQNKDRKMQMSEIKSNTNLSNVMNSMSDKQVYGLLASGVINSDLINDYIKNGENAPILACGSSDCVVGDLEYIFEEADREMKMSSVKDNELLTKVMNSLTDRQAYELIASGAIPSDMVNEYIQDGANAPILPCGSSTCSMIEYMNPGSTKPVGDGVDVVNDINGDIKDLTSEITNNLPAQEIRSAADALGNDLKEAISEIQSALNDGAVIKGADGQEISVQEALESMPEGGKINPDGTLEPVPAGSE